MYRFISTMYYAIFSMYCKFTMYCNHGDYFTTHGIMG